MKISFVKISVCLQFTKYGLVFTLHVLTGNKFGKGVLCQSTGLTLSWRMSLSYRNQFINLQTKSMDWFQYNRHLRHERVKLTGFENRGQKKPVFWHILLCVCTWYYYFLWLISNCCHRCCAIANAIYLFILYL